MAPVVYFGDSQFGKAPLSCHVWNADKTRLAAPLGDIGKVGVFKLTGNKLVLQSTLSEHTGKVTGLDWCPVTHRLVTCSSDRNAFVWVEERPGGGGVWRPTLVLLRVNRACTCVRWSPSGQKFAVGTGSRVVAVCYLDVANNFWVSKHIKKPIRSTITCLDWHPSGHLLLTGGTDCRVRVFSATVLEVEKKPESGSGWGVVKPFGNMLAEFDAEGWVHAVAFNHNGSAAAAVSHGSVVSHITPDKVTNSPSARLPFVALLWVGPSRVVCGGFDFVPVLFTLDGSGGFTETGCLDSLSGTGQKVSTGGAANARDFFVKTVDRAEGGGGGSTDLLKSVHRNVITSIHCVAGDGRRAAAADRVSTSGLDGKVVVWDVK